MRAEFGAGEANRTPDPNLGKKVLGFLAEFVKCQYFEKLTPRRALYGYRLCSGKLRLLTRGYVRLLQNTRFAGQIAGQSILAPEIPVILRNEVPRGFCKAVCWTVLKAT